MDELRSKINGGYNMISQDVLIEKNGYGNDDEKENEENAIKNGKEGYRMYERTDSGRYSSIVGSEGDSMQANDGEHDLISNGETFEKILLNKFEYNNKKRNKDEKALDQKQPSYEQMQIEKSIKSAKVHASQEEGNEKNLLIETTPESISKARKSDNAHDEDGSINVIKASCIYCSLKRSCIFLFVVMVILMIIITMTKQTMDIDDEENEYEMVMEKEKDDLHQNKNNQRNNISQYIHPEEIKNSSHLKEYYSPFKEYSSYIHKSGTFNEAPIIVGGVGDSGTRAVYYLLQEMGVNLMVPPFSSIAARDSVLFMNTKHDDAKRERHGEPQINIFDGSTGIKQVLEPEEFFQYRKSKGNEETSPKFIFTKSIWATGTSTRSGSICEYNEQSVKSVHEDFWEWGVNFTAGILLNHMKVAKIQFDKYPSDKPGYGLYGFKHPRSVLMLPYFKEASKRLGFEKEVTIKDKNGDTKKVKLPPFKFIHVIRDGRDNAFADNDNFYISICCLLYHAGKSSNCRGDEGGDISFNRCSVKDRAHPSRPHSMALQFHQDTNAQVMEWGIKELGLLRGYFPLRIEDFVLMKRKNIDCLKLLFGFLDLEHPEREEVQSILDIFEGHEDSFAGLGLSSPRKLHRTQMLFESDLASTKEDYWGFDLLGYSVANWGVSETCADWIKSIPNLIKSTMKKNETSNEYYREGRKDWRQRHIERSMTAN